MKFLVLVFVTLISSVAGIKVKPGDIVDVEGFAYVKNAWVTPEGADINRIFFIRPTIDGDIVVNGKRVTQAYITACIGPDQDTCAASDHEYVPELNVLTSPVSLEAEVTTVWVKRYETYVYGKAVSV